MTKTILFAMLLLTLAASVFAQDSMQKTPPVAKVEDRPAKPSFTLKVTNQDVIGISLKADNTKLTEIAAALTKRLKVPVALSRVMEKQRVNVDFSELLLEPAMQLLAPIVYIDYEVDSAPGAIPRPLGVFLYAHNELPPPTNAVVHGKSQAFVIEGNTEDDGGNSADQPIKITYKAGIISVKAKDQPLLDVISEVTSETGIPLEAGADSPEKVSVDLKDLPLEQAILQLSPNLRLYVRADLFRMTRTVLRVVLVEREKKS